jgi:hypothetical protein
MSALGVIVMKGVYMHGEAERKIEIALATEMEENCMPDLWLIQIERPGELKTG